jgi:hypothetical protein
VRPREVSFEPHGDGHVPEIVTVPRRAILTSRMPDFPYPFSASISPQLPRYVEYP